MKLKVSRSLRNKIGRFIDDTKPHEDEDWGINYYGIYFLSNKVLRYKRYYYWVKTGEITFISKKYEEIDEHEIGNLYEFYRLLKKLPTWRRQRGTRKC